MNQTIRIVVSIPLRELATFSNILIPFLQDYSAVIETSEVGNAQNIYTCTVAIDQTKYFEFKNILETTVNVGAEIIYL